MTSNDKDRQSKRNKMGAGIALGVGVGIAIGNSMGNVGAGLAIGIAIGIGSATILNRKSNPKGEDE